DAAAGLAEGAFDEVGVPDTVPVLAGEPQVGGQRLLVLLQTAHRGRERGVVGGGEGLDTLLHNSFGLLARFDVGGDVEDRPVGGLDFGLGAGGYFREKVAASMNP